MGRTKSPTTHLKHVILAGIVANCTNLESTTQPESACHELAKTLRKDICDRHSRERNECAMATIFTHVATLLSPCYKNLRHMQHLASYLYTDVEALTIVVKVIQSICPYLVEKCCSAIVQLTEVRKRRKVHPLLQATTTISQSTIAPNSSTIVRDLVQRELESYMLIPAISVDEHTSCPLVFWQNEEKLGRHKLLSVVAKFVYTPPIASTESERVFSLAGIVRNKTRSRLDPANLDMLLKVGHFFRTRDESVE